LFRHILARLAMLVFVLLGVTVLVFMILYSAPGDPAQMILGQNAQQEEIDALRNELGLNDPLLVQLGRYLSNILRGDFGKSYISKGPVLQEVLSRYPTTFLLAFFSVAWMVLLGIPVGIISATKQYSAIDNISMGIALLGVSMPTFWIGMLLVLWFSLKLGWFPSGGWYGPIYWILPSFSVGFHSVALIARMTRSSMLEVIRQDYIRTARAKGQTEGKVIIHHALRNALLPIVTVIGLQLGVQLGGAMVTESVFSIPGLGSYLLSSIKGRDYPAVMGGVLCIAFTFAIINLGVDILYAFIDPRIKAQYKRSKPKKLSARRSVA